MPSKTDVILWEPFSKQLASLPTNPDTGCVGLGDIQITTNKDRQIKIVESGFGSINAEDDEDDAVRFFQHTMTDNENPEHKNTENDNTENKNTEHKNIEHKNTKKHCQRHYGPRC